MANVPLDTRFIGISPDVNLKERKSALINQETAPYTMQDIKDTAGGSSYNVYTALVSWDAGGLADLNVLENTLGGDLTFDITVAYSVATVTSVDSLFTANKTFVLLNSFWDSTSNLGVGTACQFNSTSELFVSFDSYGNAGTIGATRTAFIEIRVYP